jgi:hypothetical protein
MSERRFPRWVESSSDASPELRRALLELEAERLDAERIQRLEVRFAAAFGADFGPETSPATTSPPANGPPAATGAASSGAALAAKMGLFVVLGAAALGASLFATRSAVETLRSSSRIATLKAEHRTVSVANVVRPFPAESRFAEPIEAGRASAARVVASVREHAAPSVSASRFGSVSEEARLLRAARTASKDASPARALELLDEHERRFPRGALVDERELFAIELLARQGRRAEASERLNAIRNRSPSSPYVGIAERMLGEQ